MDRDCVLDWCLAFRDCGSEFDTAFVLHLLTLSVYMGMILDATFIVFLTSGWIDRSMIITGWQKLRDARIRALIQLLTIIL